jgi:hypothetical protein
MCILLVLTLSRTHATMCIRVETRIALHCSRYLYSIFQEIISTVMSFLYGFIFDLCKTVSLYSSDVPQNLINTDIELTYMRILNSKFMYLGFVIAGLIGMSTYGISDTNTQVMAQGMNMSGSAGGGGGTVVRDSVAVPLEGKTLSGGEFIHLYDSTPYKIMNGHIAVNVPCAENSTALIKVLIGQAPNLAPAELENVSQLSTPGTLCLYHVDIPPQGRTVTDIAIINPPGGSDIDFPAGSTVVIGVNEISPL